ncbi:hypothetical protein [Bacillus sp. AFS017336]|uniref:hypothetical protein n=1 Tax=Bacillus sp. AFS017336 TaxID=2033489 RepID=UPI0015CF5977|nr:hypothetical protein [Bacillus sp. AFS017336]
MLCFFNRVLFIEHSTGQFSVAISVQKVNIDVKVTVTDKAGNVNSQTIKVVK